MNKNKFAYFRKEKALPTASGSAYKDEYELVMDGNNMKLRKVGRINVQEQIASYRDSVDLGKMIERFKRGDSTALQRNSNAFYADVSEVNTDLASVIGNNRIAADFMANEAMKKSLEEQQPVEQQSTEQQSMEQKEGNKQ